VTGVKQPRLLYVEKLRTDRRAIFIPTTRRSRTDVQRKVRNGWDIDMQVTSKVIAKIHFGWCSECILKLFNKTPTIGSTRFVEHHEFTSKIKSVLGVLIRRIHAVNFVLILLVVDERSMENG
jgi:hypothetical protein